jgi:hypothetical protein
MWLEKMGRQRYPTARELTITADCGGSNGARLRLWKLELQKFADETGLYGCAGRRMVRSGPRDDPSTLELTAMVQRIAPRSYNVCAANGTYDRSESGARPRCLRIIENTTPKRPTSANRSTDNRNSTIRTAAKINESGGDGWCGGLTRG